MIESEINKKLSNRDLRDFYREHQTVRKHNGVRIYVRKPLYFKTNQSRVYNNMLSRLTEIEEDETENFYLSRYRIALSYFRDYLRIKPVQVELIIWARGYKYFTIEQAKVHFCIGNNIKTMMTELINLNLIEVKYYGNKKRKIPYKYGLSSKGKRVAYNFYNMIEQGKIPENY